jgi:hypothetical protein
LPSLFTLVGLLAAESKFQQRLATLLLVVVHLHLHILLSLLVLIPITITSIWTFCIIMTGLTTPIANPLGKGFVLLPLPLLEDLLEALED